MYVLTSDVGMNIHWYTSEIYTKKPGHAAAIMQVSSYCKTVNEQLIMNVKNDTSSKDTKPNKNSLNEDSTTLTFHHNIGKTTTRELVSKMILSNIQRIFNTFRTVQVEGSIRLQNKYDGIEYTKQQTDKIMNATQKALDELVLISGAQVLQWMVKDPASLGTELVKRNARYILTRESSNGLRQQANVSIMESVYLWLMKESKLPMVHFPYPASHYDAKGHMLKGNKSYILQQGILLLDATDRPIISTKSRPQCTCVYFDVMRKIFMNTNGLTDYKSMGDRFMEEFLAYLVFANAKFIFIHADGNNNPPEKVIKNEKK